MSPSLNEQPKIFVAGSSWARGEWQYGSPVVVHHGIREYFANAGYVVVDASQARSYHVKVIDFLSKKLSQEFVPGDIVFFILADPLLDIIMPELASLRMKRDQDAKNLQMLTQSIQDAGGLINLIRKQQDIIYSAINRLGKVHNTKIHLIGGTYNVNTDISKKYSNLEATVISWIDLLIGHLREYPHVGDPKFGISYTWGINYIDISKYTTEFAAQVTEEFDSIMKPSVLLNELIFHPDGLHPNREGHKILFEHLVEKLKI